MNDIIIALLTCGCMLTAVYASRLNSAIAKLINEVNLLKRRDSGPVWNHGNPPKRGWYYTIINFEKVSTTLPEPKVHVALWDGHKWPAAPWVMAWMWPSTAMELLKANQPIYVRLEEPRE